MAIIKNFGFLWERKYIYRGAGGPGNAGHLFGTAPGKSESDFAEQIGVSVLYDRNQIIIYRARYGPRHDETAPLVAGAPRRR